MKLRLLDGGYVTLQPYLNKSNQKKIFTVAILAPILANASFGISVVAADAPQTPTAAGSADLKPAPEALLERVGSPEIHDVRFPEVIGRYNWGEAKIPMTGQIQSDLTPFDTIVTSVMEEQGIPGAGLTIMFRGKVVCSRGYGYADIEKTQLFTSSTVCRVASVSKWITNEAIAALIKDGTVSPETKVVPLLEAKGIIPWIPHGTEVDRRIYQITVQHLLDMSAGLAGAGMGADFLSAQAAKEMGVPAPLSVDNATARILGVPLGNTPGEKKVYSNWGYSLLSTIVTHASGKSYEQYVQENILGPNGCEPGSWRIVTGARKDRFKDEANYYSNTNIESGTRNNAFSESPSKTSDTWDDVRYDLFAGAVGWATTSDAMCRYFANRLPLNYTLTWFGSMPGNTSMVKVFPNGVCITCVMNDRNNGKAMDAVAEKVDVLVAEMSKQ